MSLRDALRAQSTACNIALRLVLVHGSKIGLRDGEKKKIERDLRDAADTLALLMGSADAERIIGERPA